MAAPVLAVRRVDLTAFRNYRTMRLNVDRRSVVLTGPNGAGKTNLLEALSLLIPGRGLRRARLQEMNRDDPLGGCWAVAARLDTPTGPADIGTGLAPASATDNSERRLVRIDGADVAGPSLLSDLVDLVWLTPAMDRIFLESTSGRRRFMDRLVYGVDPLHARRVSAYERAMRERTRLLVDGGADPAWLAALEETMAENGVALAAARREGLTRLNAAIAATHGVFPQAELAVPGLLEDWLAEMPALAAEDRFRALLAQGRARDAAAGAACEGPHRSDLAVRHLSKDQPAARCSTGEQKALLIAITLAVARLVAMRRGAAPILLLDEVVAHLDQVRRAALFAEIAALGAQAWLTGTDRNLFDELRGDAQFFTVQDGQVLSASPV